MTEPHWIGLVTIALAAAGFAYGFIRFNKGDLRLAIACIVISGFFLRLYAASDQYLHPWDERYHALVAKNLINNPLHPTLYANPVLPYDYTNWTANHTWLHKQPVPLWVMAGSMYVFGVHEFSLRLPSVLLTTLGILLMFLIARSLYNARIAMIAAFLYAIHGLIIELTAGRVATDHPDVFFLFFIQLAVWWAIRFARHKTLLNNVLCGVTIGLAILSKWLPALIVLPIWILLVIEGRKFRFKEGLLHFMALCLVIVLVALPWQVYILSVFPKEAAWEYLFNVRHLSEGLENHARPLWYHFDRMRIVFGELIYIPMTWFIYKSLKRRWDLKRLILLVWISIPFLFFSLATTKMQAYSIFTAPAIFIVTALFWNYLLVYRSRFRHRWIPLALMFFLLALPVRYSLERIKPMVRERQNQAIAYEIKSKDRTSMIGEKTILFNTPYPIETMFYTCCVAAYPFTPDASTFGELSDQGYHIIVFDSPE